MYLLSLIHISKLKPAAVSFTTDAEKAPKNVTGLEMYKESENSFEFRFDAVLEDGDSYELQYTDKAQPSEEDWVTASSSGYYDEDEDEYYEDDDALTLSKSLLKEEMCIRDSFQIVHEEILSGTDFPGGNTGRSAEYGY